MLTVLVDPRTAHAIAYYLDIHIEEIHDNSEEKEKIQDVIYALYAISNDTDAIVTDPELEEYLAGIHMPKF